jgi:hypothetical protein
MIHIFVGDDSKNKMASCEKFINSLAKDTEIFYVTKNDFNQNQTESFYSGSGLFFKKCAVIFSNILELENAKAFIFEKLPLITKSENIFVFLESKLEKSVLDSFKKTQAELHIFELSKQKKEKFNNFLLSEAFSKRDKLNLWIYFRQAVDLGVSLEELTGVLLWKTKDMLIKKDFKKFKEKELRNFGQRISYILQESRKKSKDDEVALEQFLLEAL